MGFERRNKIYSNKFYEPVLREIFVATKIYSRANPIASPPLESAKAEESKHVLFAYGI
jgi:hypothetical protein